MAVDTASVAGIVAGRNPLEYDPKSPYTLFLFQVLVIVVLSELLYYPLSKIKQPKVIAEVIVGILLGPSVMGRVPNFTDTVFPEESMPSFTLIANIAIILFLFLVGLEVDVPFIKKNFKIAVTVGVINMAIPFALGCGIAKGLYNEYLGPEESDLSFTTYMVFIAVAMCVTAFPVLVRILMSLELTKDRVGIITLSAGVLNDLLGWILLALSITLVNASNPVNTVYILLLAVAWFILVLFPIRYVLCWLLKSDIARIKSGERSKPSTLSLTVIVLLTFVSSFYTDIIGVHSIFGAFLIGLIVPREAEFSSLINEQLEGIVSGILVPLYFTLAGLKCDFGLLNTGIDWAYTIGIICLAFAGKLLGGFVGTKLFGLPNRDCLTVGILMSCKGIMEIVVLTTGLNAGLLTPKVFSIFIVMTLVTTFLTTPLTKLAYPKWYREKIAGTSINESIKESASISEIKEYKGTEEALFETADPLAPSSSSALGH